MPVSTEATGGGYDEVSIPDLLVTIADNDATITVKESGGSTDVTEIGTPDNYTIVLDSVPSGDVTIIIAADRQVTVSPSGLTFTASDWNAPRTVTVTAVDDPVLEGSHTGVISHTATGGSYEEAKIDSVTAKVGDNDTGKVSVKETDGGTRLAEDGPEDTYTVVLDIPPVSLVTITVETDGQIVANPTTLVFETSTWDVPQSVSLTAVDDDLVEGNTVNNVDHTAVGGAYGSVAVPSVPVKLTDNDKASVTVVESDGSTNVAEGGATDSYTIVLDRQPIDAVTISVTTTDAQLVVSTTTLAFATTTWNVPLEVIVTAVDDVVGELVVTSTIKHSATGVYERVLVPDVVVAITDNDEPPTPTPTPPPTPTPEPIATSTLEDGPTPTPEPALGDEEGEAGEGDGLLNMIDSLVKSLCRSN